MADPEPAGDAATGATTASPDQGDGTDSQKAPTFAAAPLPLPLEPTTDVNKANRSHSEGGGEGRKAGAETIATKLVSEESEKEAAPPIDQEGENVSSNRDPSDEAPLAEQAETKEKEHEIDGNDDNSGAEKEEQNEKDGTKKAERDVDQEDDDDDDDVGLNALDEKILPDQSKPERDESTSETHRDVEEKIIGGEIIFERAAKDSYAGWDNLRWMAYSGARKALSCDPVYKFVPGRKTLFWSGDQYLDRRLAVFQEPSVILVLRAPENMEEVNSILDMPAPQKPYFVVETVVDTKTCKLRLSPLTTVTSLVEGGDARRRSCFELVAPTQRIILSATSERSDFANLEAASGTARVENVIRQAICSSHRNQGGAVSSYSDLSWQHQVIEGTLHSIVISGNQKLLEQALIEARSRTSGGAAAAVDGTQLDTRIVDAPDESGHPALYYACKKRFSAAVALLVQYGADVNVPLKNNMTYVHICAQNLDEKSISALYSAQRKPSPNAMDGLGRTALFVTMVEGSSVGGARDPGAMDRCITTLRSFGETLMKESLYMHPLATLSSQWRADDVRVVSGHVRFRFPLAGSTPGVSLGGLYQYPIHFAIISLRKMIFAACDGSASQVETLKEICQTKESDFARTIKALLSRGFEPNERIEGILNPFDGADDLVGHYGMSPLQILGASALDAFKLKKSVDMPTFVGILKHIRSAAEVLVMNGARTTLEAPPSSRSSTRTTDSGFSRLRAMGGSPINIFPIERAVLKISAHPQFEKLLDFERLDSAQNKWKSTQNANSCNRSVIQRDNKSTLDVSLAPGGNDDATCAICWSTFGKLVNRRHRCRVTKRHICEQCSSKRMLDKGEEFRITDGQFVLAKMDEADVQSSRQQSQKEAAAARRSQAAARFDQLEREERAKRESLFGSVMDGVAKAVFGEEEEDLVARTSGGISGLSSQLGQTRDRLNERGEKLNTLAEKSDKLVDASRDFASMAKELNKKSSSFW